MVGLVIVSHSAELARGIVELARQMGGEDVVIEAAGGMEDGSIGTDAMLVMSAIEKADSPEGVLVLMDLGSAVLSAEMALDMLPADLRARVQLSEAPFVEGAVAAATAARLGSSLTEVAAEARGGLMAKVSHLGGSEPQAPEARSSEAEAEAEVDGGHEVRITVRNRLGLHARPAARFVQTAGGFDAQVTVTNMTTGKGPARATSLNAVATLGVRQGHEIAVRAAGPGAAAALEALADLAADNFGDTEGDGPSGPPPVPLPVPPSGGAARRGEIRGLAASGGVAIGPARRFSLVKPALPDDPASDPQREWERLRAALDQARSGIESDRVATARVAGEHAARIFDAHLLFLSDEDLLESARADVFEDGLNAARAWDRTVRRAAEEWRSLEDEYQRERAADILEVGARVLAHLVGVKPGPVLAEPGIVVGPEISAAQAAGLDPERALGIATSFGGPTAHSAILARSLGIPAVVGLGEALGHITEGTPLLLDGDAGVLHVEPDGDLVAEHSARRAARRAEDKRARESARQAAVTSDGRRIEVAANVAAPADVAGAVAAGADGIGLLRTEFLFMGRDGPPTEDDQYAALEDMATNLGGRPMIVRTLDAGADKPIDYLDTEHEDNPFLGERGIRLSLARPGLLATQLRAVLRVAADHPVKVMLPMVTTVDEVRVAKRILAEQRAALAADGLETPGDFEVGVMIEVPAAALMAHQLAPEVAFFSIGTNDLCQYTMAAERGNARVAGLADPYGPAVLRLIRTVVDAAEAHGRWVGVCGELAGDRQATALLVGLGVTELSMSAPAIPRIKQKVREIDREVAGTLASRAIEVGSAEEVRQLVLEDQET